MSRSGADRVRIVRHDGTVQARDGATLTAAESAEVFDRRGTIAAIEFETTAR